MLRRHPVRIDLAWRGHSSAVYRDKRGIFGLLSSAMDRLQPLIDVSQARFQEAVDHRRSDSL